MYKTHLSFLLLLTILAAGCDSGSSVPRVQLDETSVAINSLSAPQTLAERDIAYFDVTYTAKESLAAGDYSISWEVVNGLQTLDLVEWNSDSAFGGQASDQPECYGVADAEEPPITSPPDPDSDEPYTATIGFLAPSVDSDTVLTVEVRVTGDEGIGEERIVTAIETVTITVLAQPPTISLLDANLHGCVAAAAEQCGDAAVFRLTCEQPVLELSGIEQLQTLQRLELNLSGAAMEPFALLPGLTRLELSGTAATGNLEPINQLSALRGLGISLEFMEGNALDSGQLQTILPQLEFLQLCSSQLQTIGPLTAAANLSTLHLCDFGLTELSTLQSLEQLQSFSYLQRKNTDDGGELLFDFNNLQGLTLLTELTVDGERMPDAGTERGADLRVLADFVNLTKLQLNYAQVADLTPIMELTDLTELELSNNYIQNIDALAELIRVERLVLDNNLLTNLEALGSLSRLESLVADDNLITTDRGLNDLNRLQSISMRNNQLTRPSSLGNLNNLETADFGNNQITSLTSLRNRDLHTLIADGNAVTRDDFIETLPNIRSLDISCNPLTEIDDIAVSPTLNELILSPETLDAESLQLLNDEYTGSFTPKTCTE